MNLDHFYRHDYAPLKLRGRRQRTFSLYETTLRNFAKYLGRQPMLADLCDDTVTRYLAWFRALGRTAQSVNKEHANITAMWRFANRRGAVTSWPTVGRDPEPQREPQAWLESELRQLFAEVGKEAGMIGKAKACDWWRALLLCLWDTSERIGAIVSLRWQDVDLKDGWVLCRAENRKGGRQDRLYRISKETIAALKSIKKAPGLCFPWPHTKTYLWDRLGIICARAGLPDDARSKFHRIRRTVASYYEAAGGNATELLGHSSRKITEKYLDRRIVRRPQAVDRLWRLG